MGLLNKAANGVLVNFRCSRLASTLRSSTMGPPFRMSQVHMRRFPGRGVGKEVLRGGLEPTRGLYHPTCPERFATLLCVAFNIPLMY